MTDTTFDNDDTVGGNFPIIPIVIGFGLVIAALFAWFLYSTTTTPVVITNAELEVYSLTPSQIRIIELSSAHKIQQSGTEVLAALACLGANGSSKSFKTYGFMDENNNYIPTNVWLCVDSDGNWFGIVTTIFKKLGENNVARLVTAYQVSRSLFPTIDDYIGYLTTRWGATTANFIISAEKIFIKPIP